MIIVVLMMMRTSVYICVKNIVIWFDDCTAHPAIVIISINPLLSIAWDVLEDNQIFEQPHTSFNCHSIKITNHTFDISSFFCLLFQPIFSYVSFFSRPFHLTTSCPMARECKTRKLYGIPPILSTTIYPQCCTYEGRFSHKNSHTWTHPEEWYTKNAIRMSPRGMKSVIHFYMNRIMLRLRSHFPPFFLCSTAHIWHFNLIH